MSTGEWIQVGVAVVLTLTLGAVLWYAWEARRQTAASVKMAQEMREQRLLATRPILLLSPLVEEHGRWNDGIGSETIRLALPGPLADTTPVRIINVGTGVAVETTVPYKLELQHPRERVIDYLPAGSDDIEHNFYLAPKEGRPDERVLKITYCDVFGNIYESTREFHKEPDSQSYAFTPLRHGEVRRGGPSWKGRSAKSRTAVPEGRHEH